MKLVKLDYQISFADFRSLHPPFRPQTRRSIVGALLGVFGSLMLIGLVLMKQMDINAGLIATCLGAGGLAAYYSWERWNIRQAREKYEKGISQAYAGTHCVDGRTFETREDGYSVICKCGSVSRPWSGLSFISENAAVFVLGSRTEPQIIPKSAFASDGMVTEFRALISQKLNSDRLLTARSIEFTQTPSDVRIAWQLNFVRAGAWRRLIRPVVTIVLLCGLWTIVIPKEDRFVPTLAGIALLGILAFALLIRVRRRKGSWGPLRIYFSEEGLHLQDSVSEARTRWEQFLGYLEDENVILLYYNPKLYRIIPKRTLAETGDAFSTIVHRKLTPYNYREPFAAIRSQTQSPPPSPSASSSLLS